MPGIYDIPQFGGNAIPAFGGYGAGSSGAAIDAANVAANRFPLAYAFGASRNPNAFSRGSVDPNTAYETRKKATRIYPPAMAALVAQNALLGPTLDLARRGGTAYADLFGDIAPQYLQGYAGADPETSGLLSLLNVDARSLVGRSDNPLEDREIQEQIRSAGAARGTAYGQGNALNELIALDRARDERRMARGRYGAEIEEAGRRYYSPALIALLSGYQNPVQGTSTDDLLSISLNDTASRRNQHAARVAGNQALWGSVIQGVLGAAGKAAGA